MFSVLKSEIWVNLDKLETLSTCFVHFLTDENEIVKTESSDLFLSYTIFTVSVLVSFSNWMNLSNNERLCLNHRSIKFLENCNWKSVILIFFFHLHFISHDYVCRWNEVVTASNQHQNYKIKYPVVAIYSDSSQTYDSFDARITTWKINVLQHETNKEYILFNLNTLFNRKAKTKQKTLFPFYFFSAHFVSFRIYV